MYKKILVPLDGSKRAETILPHVENLAQCYQAKVIFLQVVEAPRRVMRYDAFYEVLTQEELEHWTQEAKTYLTNLQKDFRKKDIDTQTYVSHGHAVDNIIQTAEQEKVDLIAMSSHGRTGLGRVFYGSVAAGVLHRVDRPLLLIRAKGDE